MKTNKYILYLLTILTFIAFDSNAQERLILSYTISPDDQINSLSDIKIVPSSGNSSNYQNGEGIEKSYDGNMNTLYHSSYSNTVFPITLTYNFTNVEFLDYFIYHPRQGHTNGNFKELEIWYKLSDGQRTKLGEYDFKGSESATRINFPTSLIKPEQIEFIIKSGVGDNGIGYASCAEMEFYQINNASVEFLDIFEDNLATRLKSTVRPEDIQQLTNPFLREVATDMYNDRYSFNLRVGEFTPYLNLNKLDEALIAAAYNKYENPTGIYFPLGKQILIAENIPEGQQINLLIPDYRFLHDGGNIRSRSYPIRNGINIIDIKDWDGLGYISYFSDTPAQEGAIRIHFVRGQVHGYFDITKHTNDDWNTILGNITEYPVLDLVGRHCQLTFPVEDYIKYTQGKPVELINAYDSIVTYEQRFVGLEKFNKRPANRVLCRINYTYFMFKDRDGASFEKGTMSRVINPDNVLNESWGMAHEIGHIHQMKFVTWAGMGEVSVNFPNLYINWRYPSNGNSTNMSRQKTRRGINALFNKGVPHASYKTDDYNMYKLAPFAILYHYMRLERGRDDFYADLYEALRNSTDNTAAWKVADFEWYFIKRACDVSQLNLVPFFEAWGFLYATDIEERSPFEVEDYSSDTYTLPDSKVNELKEYINSKEYITPDINSIMSDRVINSMTNVDA